MTDLVLNETRLLKLAQEGLAAMTGPIDTETVPIGEVNGVVFFLKVMTTDSAESEEAYNGVRPEHECIQSLASYPLSADEDPMYEKCKEEVLKSRKASISFVQRKLVIGYNRASRLIERMETEGLVGPMDRSGVRVVKGGQP